MTAARIASARKWASNIALAIGPELEQRLAAPFAMALRKITPTPIPKSRLSLLGRGVVLPLPTFPDTFLDVAFASFPVAADAVLSLSVSLKDHAQAAETTASPFSECDICFARSANATIKPCGHHACPICIERQAKGSNRCFFCNATMEGYELRSTQDASRAPSPATSPRPPSSPRAPSVLHSPPGIGGTSLDISPARGPPSPSMTPTLYHLAALPSPEATPQELPTDHNLDFAEDFSATPPPSPPSPPPQTPCPAVTDTASPETGLPSPDHPPLSPVPAHRVLTAQELMEELD
jgi:hypothetical protein